jgi:hypothetical protein
MNTILIFSTKRSGHHAIIEWIGNNMNGGIVFHNDTHWRSFVDGKKVYLGKRKEVLYGGKSKKNLTVYNFEDININQHSKIVKSPFVVNHDKTIIVLRDVYNMVASSIKSTTKNVDVTIRKRVDRWKEYCFELLGETDWVDKNKLHFINYNMWFIDREYRDLIGKSIGFINEDNGIDKVSSYGGGSSFDKVSDARNMNIFDRWKKYENHKLFTKHITEDIDNLNRKVFGFDLEDLKNGYYQLNNNSWQN